MATHAAVDLGSPSAPDASATRDVNSALPEQYLLRSPTSPLTIKNRALYEVAYSYANQNFEDAESVNQYLGDPVTEKDIAAAICMLGLVADGTEEEKNTSVLIMRILRLLAAVGTREPGVNTLSHRLLL